MDSDDGRRTARCAIGSMVSAFKAWLRRSPAEAPDMRDGELRQQMAFAITRLGGSLCAAPSAQLSVLRVASRLTHLLYKRALTDAGIRSAASSDEVHQHLAARIARTYLTLLDMSGCCFFPARAGAWFCAGVRLEAHLVLVRGLGEALRALEGEHGPRRITEVVELLSKASTIAGDQDEGYLYVLSGEQTRLANLSRSLRDEVFAIQRACAERFAFDADHPSRSRAA